MNLRLSSMLITDRLIQMITVWVGVLRLAFNILDFLLFSFESTFTTYSMSSATSSNAGTFKSKSENLILKIISTCLKTPTLL